MNIVKKLKSDKSEDLEEKISIIRNSLLFKNASDGVLSEIVHNIEIVNLREGAPLFLENELSQHVYFVLSGKLEICKFHPRLMKLNQLKVLKSGDHLSELSVLTGSNHSVSCFALEDSILFRLSDKVFMEILNKHHKLTRSIIHSLARLNQQFTHSNNYIDYFNESDFSFVPEMMKIVPKHMIDAYSVVPLCIEEKTINLAIRDPHNVLFYKYFREHNPDLHLKICAINVDDYNRVYEKIMRCYKGIDTDSHLTPKDKKGPNDSDITVSELLALTTIFSKMCVEMREKLAPYFKRVEAKRGYICFEPGMVSDKLYLIARGEVELVKRLESGGSTHVINLSKHTAFGEISLLTDSTHSLVARTTVESTLYYIDKSVFNKLMDNPNFSTSLATALAERLQESNKRLQVLYHSEKIECKDVNRLKVLPVDLMEKQKLLPLKIDGKKLIIGVVNPDDEMIYLVINRYLSDYQIDIRVITEGFFGETYKLFDTRDKSSYKTREKGKQVIIDSGSATPTDYLKTILNWGISKRASDIHVEPMEDCTVVRFRVDGELQELPQSMNSEFGLQLISKIKVLSKLDISEKRFPQDGQFVIDESGDKHVRVSTLPVKFGEKVVMRLIKTRTAVIPLETLAPDREFINYLKDIVRYKQGLFLVTGPTGAGKTSTIYSLLNEINNIKKNVISVEDPVELMIPGINQIEVNEAIGLTYSKVLRHILRQDPDVIMIGEIRDAESAQIAFDAALTGHLVLATLHTCNTIDLIPRLLELGIDSSTLASGLIGVMAQRLLPAICPQCKGKRDTTDFEKIFFKERLDVTAPDYVYAGVGCERCQDSGYYDRVPVFEYWKMNSRIRDVILSKGTCQELERAVNYVEFRDLEEFGTKMALLGLTTLDKVNEYLHGSSD